MRPLATCAFVAVATLFAGIAGAQPSTVTCESMNYRDQECPVPRGPVELVQQLSTTPGDCIEGQTWGFNDRNNTIWVRNGCRAQFRVGYAGEHRHEHSDESMVTCESMNYRDQECAVAHGPVELVQQLSTTPGDCIEGQTWGFNDRNNTIWVRRGCRAEFRVSYAGEQRHEHSEDSMVTCESMNYRDQQCPVSRGPVALARQLSTTPGDCIEGQTWGYNDQNNTIWVRNGCRAEFRVGYR
jgi:hypothetical protein